MILVRKETLKEAANKAELNQATNYWQSRWLNKDSIFNLDRNSIEI